MPTYDFKCAKCQDITSLVTSIKETTPTPYCFKCKAEMTRQYHISAIKFKGSGYYSTDK